MMPPKFRIALAATLVALTVVSVVDSASAAKLAVAVVLAADDASADLRPPLEHDPEKWVPVFRKDHAQTRS